ncbi:hypothetical protein ABZ532_14160 [Streptomyces sp. NPDC019396]|uniref:hypothetical protein n=1 Tax=Streptomyces sp. NPDC019396 TaxID=3154687 RepID=UPI0033D3BAB2
MTEPRDVSGAPGASAEPDDDYSATVLASHWIERPEPEPGPGSEDLTVPDRTEGPVLRFGPGVTATTVWHGTLPGLPPAAPVRPVSRFAGLRRYTLAAVILVAVLCYLGWDRYGPGVSVRELSVSTPAGGPGCDGTSVITALVETNGRPGTVRYRWVRNDGTVSEELAERLARGQRQARLKLRWTFHGEGVFDARAEVRITSPVERSAATRFTYTCG